MLIVFEYQISLTLPCRLNDKELCRGTTPTIGRLREDKDKISKPLRSQTTLVAFSI